MYALGRVGKKLPGKLEQETYRNPEEAVAVSDPPHSSKTGGRWWWVKTGPLQAQGRTPSQPSDLQTNGDREREYVGLLMPRGREKRRKKKRKERKKEEPAKGVEVALEEKKKKNTLKPEGYRPNSAVRKRNASRAGGKGDHGRRKQSR